GASPFVSRSFHWAKPFCARNWDGRISSHPFIYSPIKFRLHMSGVLKINHESVLNLRTVGVPELSDNSVFSPKSDGSLLANLKCFLGNTICAYHRVPLLFRVRDVNVRQYDDRDGGERRYGTVVSIKEYETPSGESKQCYEPTSNTCCKVLVVWRDLIRPS